MNINLNFKIRLSKKQTWEMSQLNEKHRFTYLLSFIGPSGFKDTYTNLASGVNDSPFGKLRPYFKHFDRLSGGTVRYHKDRLSRERKRLLSKIPVSELRRMIGVG